MRPDADDGATSQNFLTFFYCAIENTEFSNLWNFQLDLINFFNGIIQNTKEIFNDKCILTFLTVFENILQENYFFLSK